MNTICVNSVGKNEGVSRRTISEQISTLLDRLDKKGRCIVIWESGRLLFCTMTSRNAMRYLAKPTCLGVYDAEATYGDVHGDLKVILQQQ